MDEAIRRLTPEIQISRRSLDGLYVEAGRRAHIMGRLDGSYGGFREVSKEIVNPPGGGTEGVWAEPLRLMDYVHFHIWDEHNGLASLERNCEQYVREVGYSRFIHRFASHPYLGVEKRVWVPRHRPAVVIELHLMNESDRERRVRIYVESRSHLSLGWPRRDMGHDFHRYDADLKAVVALDAAHPDWVALWGADHPPAAHHLGTFHAGLITEGGLSPRGLEQSDPDQRSSGLQFDLRLPPAGEARLMLVTAGGDRGLDQAALEYRSVMAGADALFSERIQHYRGIMERTVRLESPDYQLDKAFQWAKVGTEDFKHDDPELGLCYFAGFPAYNFYFASDSFRILHGAICAGDFEDTKEILRMILSYQAKEPGPDTLPGEIWHEMSTTGDTISPNFCTLDFPVLMEYFYRWTGDLAFLEEMYPNLRAAVEWGYLNDIDGDGLLENGPEGEMADSAFEDTNMEGSHLAPNLAWFHALRSGARLAALIGDQSSATRWEQTANDLKLKLNRLYWNESRREFEETIRPDGSFDASWRGITLFDQEIVDEGKAHFGLQKLLHEESRLTDPQAFFNWKQAEKAYATWREHLSWYLVARGDRARHLLRNHMAEAGATAIRAIAAVPFNTGTPGHFPEVIGMHDPITSYVKGCAHQAWSAACGILYPVIAGLFGVVPDAASHSVTIDPHWPEGWKAMRLERLRVGGHILDVKYRRVGDRIHAELLNEAEQDLVAVLGFALPRASEISDVTMDDPTSGRVDLDRHDPRLSVRYTPEDVHAYVRISVPAGGAAAVELRYGPVNLELNADTYLDRTQAGASVIVVLGLVNQSGQTLAGQMRLDLPSGWHSAAMPLMQPVELAPGEAAHLSFELDVPHGLHDGYHTVWASFEGPNGPMIAKPMYLPVFGAMELRLDGRGVARAGSAYALQITASNLTQERIETEFVLDSQEGLMVAAPSKRVTLNAGKTGQLSYSVSADWPGNYELPMRATAGRSEWRMSHRLKVVPTDRPIVLYSGFLGSPITSDESLEVVNMPANYAVRKPHVMDQLLPIADVVLTSDQHDAVFTPTQIAQFVRYIDSGGKLLLFCYWSSPWGRGFHHTYGNVAGTELAEMLPLVMRPGIGQGRKVLLEGRGADVLGAIDWGECPAYDFNLAEAHPQAEVWARSEASDPLIASRAYGKGRLVTIAVDCFGYGTQGDLLRWPGVPAMIRRVVLDLV